MTKTVIRDRSDLDFSGQTEFSDLSPLVGFTRLENLDLSETSVTDLSPLSSCSNLKVLRLNGCQVVDLTPLAGLTQLEELQICQTDVSDLSALASLKNLTWLRANYCPIQDISALAGLDSLTRLDLAGCQVSDFSPLSGLANLVLLNLRHTDFDDCRLLSDCASLANLDLSRTEITGLNGLESLHNIWCLEVTGTHVSDFSLLGSLPKLRELAWGEYLDKTTYGALSLIPVSELGLNWHRVCDAELAVFLKGATEAVDETDEEAWFDALTPEQQAAVQRVWDFIVDYKVWNDNAIAAYRYRDDQGTHQTKAAYDELLQEHCHPDVQPQEALFSADSMHDPDGEAITELEMNGNSARVSTRRTDATGFTADFEFHLVCEGDNWRITSLRYQGDDGVYESL